MIDRNHDLPIIRQAEVLNISRGSGTLLTSLLVEEFGDLVTCHVWTAPVWQDVF